MTLDSRWRAEKGNTEKGNTWSPGNWSEQGRLEFIEPAEKRQVGDLLHDRVWDAFWSGGIANPPQGDAIPAAATASTPKAPHSSCDTELWHRTV